MDQKIKYALLSLLALAVIISGIFIYKNQADREAQNGEATLKKEAIVVNKDEKEIIIEDGDEITIDEISEEENEEENEAIVSETVIQPKQEEEKIEYPENSKEYLADKLRTAIDNKNYELFADTLRKVYDSNWQGEEELKKLESELYVTGTGYFQEGNISEALEMAEIISPIVFESWRFNYLKIICLEKLGLDEFAKGNYDEAEEYAMKILQIEFRPEGANLLGDIYIKKIEANLAAGDKEAAQNNLNTIWDYEVDESRRNKLIELKAEIESL